MENKTISMACEIVGGQSKLASCLDVTPATINQWVKGVRPVPAVHCPDIERLTKGEVRCEALCPDVDWSYIRGTKKKAA